MWIIIELPKDVADLPLQCFHWVFIFEPRLYFHGLRLPARARRCVAVHRQNLINKPHITEFSPWIRRWNPQTHREFPVWFRQQARTLLCCRLRAESPLHLLDLATVYRIIAMTV